MRDPERIPVFLDELKELWQRHPGWRFGQLIFNAYDGIWDTTEFRFFRIEDDDSLEVIQLRLEDGF